VFLLFRRKEGLNLYDKQFKRKGSYRNILNSIGLGFHLVRIIVLRCKESEEYKIFFQVFVIRV